MGLFSLCDGRCGAAIWMGSAVQRRSAALLRPGTTRAGVTPHSPTSRPSTTKGAKPSATNSSLPLPKTGCPPPAPVWQSPRRPWTTLQKRTLENQLRTRPRNRVNSTPPRALVPRLGHAAAGVANFVHRGAPGRPRPLDDTAGGQALPGLPLNPRDRSSDIERAKKALGSVLAD
jgi:hypothetical protein